MKRKILCAFLIAAILISAAPAALAASGLGNFKVLRTYGKQYSDVPTGVWYYSYVSRAYELGLIEGRSASQFSPDGEMTLAEVITLACRINAIYSGGNANFEQGSPWYTPYVTYAEQNGIIKTGEFKTGAYTGSVGYEENATRAQIAYVLCNSLPSSALPEINDVRNTIPDINGAGSISQYSESSQIKRLYAAGVLTGVDEYCSFQGNDNVKRGEAAALLIRLVDEGERKIVKIPVQMSVEEILLYGYWRNSGVTNGTNAVYKFHSDGTFTAAYSTGDVTGTYTLRNGVLNTSGDYWSVKDMVYDAATGIFGKDMQIMIQGMWMTLHGMYPITKAEYDDAIAQFNNWFR